MGEEVAQYNITIVLSLIDSSGCMKAVRHKTNSCTAMSPIEMQKGILETLLVGG